MRRAAAGAARGARGLAAGVVAVEEDGDGGREALEQLGLHGREGGAERRDHVGQPCLVDGQDVSASDLDEALASLPAEDRPEYVRVVDELPMTLWHRPIAGPLRRDPLPPPGRYFARTADGSYQESRD